MLLYVMLDNILLRDENLFFMYELKYKEHNINMNNEEYDKLVSCIVKKESTFKNAFIAFISGGIMGLIGEYLYNYYIRTLSVNSSDSFLLVFITFVLVGSLLTGLGFFDKVLSFTKSGLIVPSTGFANSMTSSSMDYRNEGFVKGIGGNMFKLTGSIILYGVIFGLIFGFIRGVLL